MSDGRRLRTGSVVDEPSLTDGSAHRRHHHHHHHQQHRHHRRQKMLPSRTISDVNSNHHQNDEFRSGDEDPTSFVELERCPSCRKSTMTTTNVDGDIQIATCSSCHASFGVDDAMDADSLRRVLRLLDDDQAESVKVSVPGVVCGGCGNEDVELLQIADVDEKRQTIKLRCLVCDEEQVLSMNMQRRFSEDELRATIGGLGGDEEGERFDSGFDSARPSVSDELLAEGGDASFGDDWVWEQEVTFDDSPPCYDEQDDDVWLTEEQPSRVQPASKPNGQRQCFTQTKQAPPLQCPGCETTEPDVFQKNFDVDNPTKVRCLVCGAVFRINDVPPSSYVECDKCMNSDATNFCKQFDDDGLLMVHECKSCWNRIVLPTAASKNHRGGHGGGSKADVSKSVSSKQPKRRGRLESDDAGDFDLITAEVGRYFDRSDDTKLNRHHHGVGDSRKHDGSKCRQRRRKSSNEGGIDAENPTGRGKTTMDQEETIGRTRIQRLSELERGDHVAWHKWYVAWHHAIVVDVDAAADSLTVIHYSGAVRKLDGHFVSVRLETLTDAGPLDNELYRIDYPRSFRCYPQQQVIDRAAERLGEHEYNPLTKNCEHFARWCKTGREDCGQVKKFVQRLKSVRDCAVARAMMEAGGGLAPGLRAVRNIECGALAANVAFNLAAESAIFAKDAYDAYRKYKSGAISEADFRQQLCKHGCECAGGLMLSSALGIVGQIFIPVPLVGGLIGSTLGNLIGRFIGAAVGKKLCMVNVK